MGIYCDTMDAMGGGGDVLVYIGGGIRDWGVRIGWGSGSGSGCGLW